MKESGTYTKEIALLHQQRELLALSPAHVQLPGIVICGSVDVGEGNAVRPQNSLDARGSGDDVRRAGREGGEEVEGHVIVPLAHVGRHGCGLVLLCRRRGKDAVQGLARSSRQVVVASADESRECLGVRGADKPGAAQARSFGRWSRNFFYSFSRRRARRTGVAQGAR